MADLDAQNNYADVPDQETRELELRAVLTPPRFGLGFDGGVSPALPEVATIKGFIPTEVWATVSGSDRVGGVTKKEKLASGAFARAVKETQDGFSQVASLIDDIARLPQAKFDRAIARLEKYNAQAEARQRKEIKLLLDHNPKLQLATTKDGSLKLRSTEHGLQYEATIKKSRAGDILVDAANRDKIAGSSFGFKKQGATSVNRNADKQGDEFLPLPPKQGKMDGSDIVSGKDGRTDWSVVKSIDLKEVSVLRTFGGRPAYKDTQAEVTKRSKKLTRGDILREYVRVVF